MYKIYINDILVMETPLPCYVYWDDKISSFRTCNEPEAEAVLINQKFGEDTETYYADIDYKTARHEEFPVVKITKG